MLKNDNLKNNPRNERGLPEKKYRVLFLTFLLMGVVGYAFGKYPDLFFGPSQQTFQKAKLDLAPGVVAVPPLQMEETLAASYRLKPDNRFLLAVDKVSQLITGNAGQVDARYENKSWTIFHNGEAVGKVPEIPDFPDFLTSLKSWARLLSERHPTFPAMN